MALLFELVAEFGQSQHNAVAFAGRLNGQSWQLSNDVVCRYEFIASDVWEDGKIWWCRIVPKLKEAGSFNHGDVALVQLTKQLYSSLELLSGFRFAIIGWEAEAWLTLDEVVCSGIDEKDLPRGLVVSGDVCRRMGSPEWLAPFGCDSFWLPLLEHDYSLVANGELTMPKREQS